MTQRQLTNQDAQGAVEPRMRVALFHSSLLAEACPNYQQHPAADFAAAAARLSAIQLAPRTGCY